jgi:DNA-directed RNA polymerase subunit M/transcription elongation factor TFIIS
MISIKIRDNVFNKFNKIFGKDIAKKIELSIFNFSTDYSENNNTPFLLLNIYESKADEVYCMLSGDNLQNATKAINSGTINPINIATMKPSDLNLALSNKKYVDIIKKRELNMMLSETKSSMAFECKKCHKRKCNIIEKQVRSADEPATQFITCLECGHVFTIN